MSAGEVIDAEVTALAVVSSGPPDDAPQKRVMSLDEIRNMGAVFYASGLFKDLKSEAQAIVKIVAGQELGIGPMSAMTQIQIVEGKPTLTAPAIGGRIKSSGRYDYSVIEHSNDVCHIRFFDRGAPVGESRFTMDDARAAGLAGKDVWRKYPRNMLFARAMTNGARWYCADVFSGAIYTAEELGGDAPPLAPPASVAPALPAGEPQMTPAQKLAAEVAGLEQRWLAAGGSALPVTFREAMEGLNLRAIREAVETLEAQAASEATPPASDAPAAQEPPKTATCVGPGGCGGPHTEAQHAKAMTMAGKRGLAGPKRYAAMTALSLPDSIKKCDSAQIGRFIDWMEAGAV